MNHPMEIRMELFGGGRGRGRGSTNMNPPLLVYKQSTYNFPRRRVERLSHSELFIIFPIVALIPIY